jgi:hypothetical protein
MGQIWVCAKWAFPFFFYFYKANFLRQQLGMFWKHQVHTINSKIAVCVVDQIDFLGFALFSRKLEFITNPRYKKKWSQRCAFLSLSAYILHEFISSSIYYVRHFQKYDAFLEGSIVVASRNFTISFAIKPRIFIPLASVYTITLKPRNSLLFDLERGLFAEDHPCISKKRKMSQHITEM